MKKEIIYLILLISLAFNLAFIGMFIWHRSHKSHPPREREFPILREAFKNEYPKIRNLNDEFIGSRHEFMEFLRSEKFDVIQADSLLEKMIFKQLEMERNLGRNLIELRKKGKIPPRRQDHPPFDEKRDNFKRRRK